MTINDIINASKIMLGSQEIEKLYIGNTELYLKSSSTPSESFFCKLELTDGTIVDLEGSGELTKAMVATPYASTLYKMHVGNLCTSIGYQAVMQCKQLVELVVDEGVTTIAKQAFNQDSKLKVIDLPSTLTSVGAYSFHNMGTVVGTVIIRATTPPSLGNNNLFDSANTTIYVPDLSLSTYQTEWSGWATRIKALSTIYHYYDAEILYLEGNGGLKIILNFDNITNNMIANNKLEYITNIQLTSTDDGAEGVNNLFYFVGVNSNKYYSGCGSNWLKSRGVPDLNNHELKLVIENNTVTYYLDNNTIDTYSFNQGFSSNLNKFGLFYCIDYNGPALNKLRKSYAKLTLGNQIIFECIPVRVGLVGYMYDKVSKLLLSNQGTGSFTLGPDKLPSGYTELEYIETSGTQWIDTGITSTSTMVSQIKFNLLSTSSSSHVYGYRKANDYESYRLFFNGSTGLMYDGPGTSSSNKRRITMNNSVSKDTVWEFELGNNYVKNLVTGNNIGSSNSKYLDGISTITLSYWEGDGSNSDVSSARWYYAKIYEDNTLILDLIPVRKDGVGYMFDMVSKTLFTNQGTGDFILGPDKS